MSKYDTEVDLNQPNTSHAQMVALVGTDKRVLDVGCATGYLARALVERGCTVSGVEADVAAAEKARPDLERLVVGDLEHLDLAAEFGDSRFDVVLFGDILEHLRDPRPVLRAVRELLTRDGAIVISIPNVAHAAVRLALLKGKWEYRALGLLDETHVRFFTRDSLRDLLAECGFVAVDVRRTTAGPFDTELGIKPEDYDPALVAELLCDPDATTYQFVLRAVPDDTDHAVEILRARFLDAEQRAREVDAELVEQRAQCEALRVERDRARAELQALRNSRVLRWTASARRAFARARRLRSS